MAVVGSDSLDFVQMPGRRSADPLAGMGLGCSLRIVEMNPDPERRAHRHPLSEEIVVVMEGSGHVWLEGERTPVTVGDVVVIPAGSLHATVPAGAMRLACFFPHPTLSENIEESDRPVGDPSTVGEEKPT